MSHNKAQTVGRFAAAADRQGVPGVRRSRWPSCSGRGSACAGSGVGQRDQSTSPARPSRIFFKVLSGSLESACRTGSPACRQAGLARGRGLPLFRRVPRAAYPPVPGPLFTQTHWQASCQWHPARRSRLRSRPVGLRVWPECQTPHRSLGTNTFLREHGGDGRHDSGLHAAPCRTLLRCIRTYGETH